jgi:hypothetical protein
VYDSVVPEEQKINKSPEDKMANWIELQPAPPLPNPEQVLAKEVVAQRAAQANRLLFRRSKAIATLGVITLLNFCVTFVGFVLSAVHHNSALEDGLQALLTLFNLPLQAGMAAYLARAKDPDNCRITLKVFLILNLGELFVGFYSFGSMTLTIFTLIVTLVAYARVSQLKYDDR